MLQIISKILLLQISLIEGMETQINDNKRLCFLQSKLYHPQSGECKDPLEQGPCDEDQWLAPSTQDKMVLECQQRPETLDGESFKILSNGSVVREKEQENGSIFKIGDCKPTERLLPVNFAMNTKPCPKNHQCSSKVSESLKVLEAIVKTNRFLEIELTHKFFKNMICSREPQKQALCLPRDKTNPVTAENLYNSLHMPELICVEKPCPSGKEPYQDEKGYIRCESPFPRFTDVNSKSCKKRRILRRGRCTPRWIG